MFVSPSCSKTRFPDIDAGVSIGKRNVCDIAELSDSLQILDFSSRDKFAHVDVTGDGVVI